LRPASNEVGEGRAQRSAAPFSIARQRIDVARIGAAAHQRFERDGAGRPRKRRQRDTGEAFDRASDLVETQQHAIGGAAGEAAVEFMDRQRAVGVALGLYVQRSAPTGGGECTTDRPSDVACFDAGIGNHPFRAPQRRPVARADRLDDVAVRRDQHRDRMLEALQRVKQRDADFVDRRPVAGELPPRRR
jgi:hypothetical protein